MAITNSSQELQGVMVRFHDRLREAAIKDHRLKESLHRRLKDAENLQKFERWLETHRDYLKRLETTECVSSWLSSYWKQPEHESGQALSRIALIDEVLGYLKSKEFSDDSVVERILLAGLGVEFMQYSSALRQNHNRALICDLLPNARRSQVMQSVAVPHGEGTVGWIMLQAVRSAKPSAAAKSDGHTIDSLPISSSFSDFKGRVALEDYVQGNRSWLVAPLLDSLHGHTHGVGVVIAFFPVDGLFLSGPTTVGNEPGFTWNDTILTNFEKAFRRAVTSVKHELLLAVRGDDATSLYQTWRESVSSKALFDESGSELSSDAFLQRMKESIKEQRDDALGRQLLIDLKNWRVRGGDVKRYVLRGEAIMRENTFTDRLHDLLRTACLYPSRWAPQAARTMTAYESLLHEHDGAIKTNDRMPNVPLWYAPGDTDGSGIVSTPEFYDAGACQQNIAEELGGKIAEEIARYGYNTANDRLTRDVKAGLELHSPLDRVYDLLVPLVTEDKWCTGFFRIRCILPEAEASSSTRSAEKMARLHGFFAAAPAACQARSATAQMLCELDKAGDAKELSSEGVKTLLDMRRLICQSVADHICRPFLTGGKAPEDVMELTRGVMNNLHKELLKSIDECRLAMKELLRALRADRNNLPAVTFVSVWLSHFRPIITEHSGSLIDSLDEQLFLADRGAARMLRYFVRLGNLCGTDLKLGFHRRRDRRHGSVTTTKRDMSSVVVVPELFCNGIARNRPLDLDVMTRGKTTITRLSQESHTKDNWLDMQWKWTRFAEPEAVSIVPDHASDNILPDDDSLLDSVALTDEVIDLGNDTLRTLTLDQVIRPRDPSSTKDIEKCQQLTSRLNAFARFMSDDAVTEEDPSWLLTPLSGKWQQHVLLTYPGQPASRSVDKSREIELKSLQADQKVMLARQAEQKLNRSQRTDGFIQHHVAGAIRRLRKSSNPDLQLNHITYLLDVKLDEEDMLELQNLNTLPLLLKALWKTCVVDQTGKPSTNCDLKNVPDFEYPFECISPLYMIFTSLLENAARHAEGGHVSMIGRMSPDSKNVIIAIENSGFMNDDWARFLKGDGREPRQEGPRKRAGLIAARSYIDDNYLELPKVSRLKHKKRTKIELTIPLSNFSPTELDNAD